MKIKLLILALLAVCTFAPGKASVAAGVTMPTITWDDTTDVIPAPVGSAEFSNVTAFGQAPGDPREQAGFTGTFFSTVDVTPFAAANVWLVEPGSTTLSDWIGINSLTRVAVGMTAGGGWNYTIDMQFVSDSTDESQGNIPAPPTSPPWDAYPFVTETGTLQDITGAFRLNGPFPGYTAPAGLTDLISIQVASDLEPGGNGNGNHTPDAGSTMMLFGLGLGALGLARQRLIAVRA